MKDTSNSLANKIFVRSTRAVARDGRVGGVAINFADRRAWFWVWLFLDSFSFLTATPSSSAHRGTLKPFHVVKRNVCSLIFSYFRSLWIYQK